MSALEKVRAEVERRMLEDYNTGDKELDAVAQGVCASMLYFIDSLQEEQQEVDLEKEIETSIRLLNGLHTLEDNKSWYKGRYEELKELARLFYELGKNGK